VAGVTNQDIAGWQVLHAGIVQGWVMSRAVAPTSTPHLLPLNTRISSPLSALFSRCREMGEG